MTTPTDPPLPATPDREEIASVHDDLHRLLVAAKAVRLALEAARDASQAALIAELPSAQILESWQAVNLLMRAAFETLYHQVSDTIDVVRLMLPLLPD